MKVLWQGMTTESNPNLWAETHLNSLPSYVMKSVLDLMAQRGWKDCIFVDYDQNKN